MFLKLRKKTYLTLMMNTYHIKYFQYHCSNILKTIIKIYIINSAIHPWSLKRLYNILEVHSKSFAVLIWSIGSTVKELIKLIILTVEKKG